jgi:transposase
LQEYIDTVIALSKRLDALDGHLQSAAGTSVFWPVIKALMALRGVNLLAAAAIVAEIGDLKRFANAPQLMAYLGVVPSERIKRVRLAILSRSTADSHQCRLRVGNGNCRFR